MFRKLQRITSHVGELVDGFLLIVVTEDQEFLSQLLLAVTNTFNKYFLVSVPIST
jgi:hypothetical protein